LVKFIDFGSSQKQQQQHPAAAASRQQQQPAAAAISRSNSSSRGSSSNSSQQQIIFKITIFDITFSEIPSRFSAIKNRVGKSAATEERFLDTKALPLGI